MKSMWPPLAAIFFMTYFHRAGGPSAPPGSATGTYHHAPPLPHMPLAMHAPRHTWPSATPPCEQTDTCKNIAFLQQLLRAVITISSIFLRN